MTRTVGPGKEAMAGGQADGFEGAPRHADVELATAEAFFVEGELYPPVHDQGCAGVMAIPHADDGW